MPTIACIPYLYFSDSICLLLDSESVLTALSSLTSGRGTFTMTLPRQARQPQHSSYELVPADVQQALLKANEEAANEEE